MEFRGSEDVLFVSNLHVFGKYAKDLPFKYSKSEMPDVDLPYFIEKHHRSWSIG